MATSNRTQNWSLVVQCLTLASIIAAMGFIRFGPAENAKELNDLRDITRDINKTVIELSTVQAENKEDISELKDEFKKLRDRLTEHELSGDHR